MTPAISSLSVPAKVSPQNTLPPIPTTSPVHPHCTVLSVSQAAVPTLATAPTTPNFFTPAAGATAALLSPITPRLKESGNALFLVCATFRLQKPKIKKQPYYYLQ